MTLGYGISRHRLTLTAIALVVASHTALAQTQPARHGDIVPADEIVLAEAIADIKSERIDLALGNLERLVKRNPKFKLAQMVYADALMAKAGFPVSFGGNNKPAEPTSNLRHEARVRFRHYLSPPRSEQIPTALLRMSRDQRYAVVVDLAKSRLYLFENRDGQPRLVRDMYVSAGKNGARKQREGDNRTPVGVYFVTGRISPEKLPDFYGRGAFPVNYPNAWDRRLGRTGYGIWIHGVPTATYARAPRASEGCMAIANVDLDNMWNELNSRRTPVIIADGLQWANRAEVSRSARDFESVFDRWRKDWESRDISAYARHYSRDFSDGRKNYAAWLAHKRRVNRAKKYIRIAVGNFSVFSYPGESDMRIVTFDQDYRSDSFRNQVTKRQYWRREVDGEWRIVYESTVRQPARLRRQPVAIGAG